MVWGALVRVVLKGVVKTVAKNSTRGAGPSGKALIHTVNHSSKKAAREAAQHAGKGKPIHHSHGPSGGGHYHSTNSSGKKIEYGSQGGVHHKYKSQK